MRLDTEATICSIATGSVGAIRGAIRISGPDSCGILQRVFPQIEEELAQVRRATVLSSVVELDALGKVDVDVFVWPDSRSYTGQPAAELHMLGAPVLLEAMQTKLLAHGAVLAQPGEFTLRAFLAGRLDLTQCEAVLGVIHAASDRSLHTALDQLAGGLSEPLRAMRTQLVHLLADIEAGLDFVDEDIQFVSKTQIAERLQSASQTISATLAQMQGRSGQTRFLQIAVVGHPNAGKSSLVNAIVGSDVSIVSEMAGTTRDYVRARVDWDGLILEFLDTAGIEAIHDQTPRALAQQFTESQLKSADLVWWCVPCEISSERVSLLKSRAWSQLSCPVWLIRTKSDLAEGSRVFDKRVASGHAEELVGNVCFEVSIYEPTSIDLLKQSVCDWVRDLNEEQGNVVPMTAQRCRSSLEGAFHAIDQAMKAVEYGEGDEVIASEIRLALDDIGVVAGTVYTDDILDALFSRFCIGK